MKTNKLVAAGLLALSMTLAPVTSMVNVMPVMAAEKTSKDSNTIYNATDHDYKAYQIFKGTHKEGETGGILGTVEWADAVTDKEGLLNAITTSDLLKDKDGNNIFEDCTTAAQVADVLANNQTYGEKFARVMHSNIEKH